MTEEVTHTDICTWYSIVGNFCISGRKVHRINLCFNFRMLGLRDHAHAAHLLVQASPWHSMMPGLRGFLACYDRGTGADRSLGSPLNTKFKAIRIHHMRERK